VLLDGRGYEVVGVMPRDFAFPEASTSFWVPFVLPSSGPALLSRYAVFARVRRDVSFETSAAEINTILRENGEAESRRGERPMPLSAQPAQPGFSTAMPAPASPPASNSQAPANVSPQAGGPRIALVSLQDQLVAPVRPALLVLSGAAGLLLLIACANVANLLLARSTARQREFAIRLALGSGRGRLVRQLLAESLLVSLIGGLAGAGLAVGAVRLLGALSTGLARTDLGPAVALPRLEHVAIDPAALAFALVTALVTGLIIGVAPVIVSHSVAKQRLYAILLALFAAVAVLLASVGVFGVVAYGVTQRTREIGVRMALGARRQDVLWLVLGQSLWLIGEGLLAGLLGAAGTTRLLRGWLFGLTPLDGTTFFAAAALFAMVASIAAWLPARRAVRVDPLVALRTD
jgi:predicted lysophospholipase L1 biosynthesis ABC-type transport system permease subunit